MGRWMQSEVLNFGESEVVLGFVDCESLEEDGCGEAVPEGFGDCAVDDGHDIQFYIVHSDYL